MSKNKPLDVPMKNKQNKTETSLQKAARELGERKAKELSMIALETISKKQK